MKKIALLLAALVAQQASATVFNFAGLADKNSHIAGWADALSKGLPGEHGFSSFSWTVDGLTVTATAFQTTSGTSAYAYLDADGAGLGVCKHLSGNSCNPSNDDNVQSGEALRLTFSKAVSLDQISFKDGVHENSFASTAKFGLTVDGGAPSNLKLVSNFTAATADGKTFIFTGKGNTDSTDFYINSLTVSAVPEPETYAMLGLGLLGVLAARRRKIR